MNNLQNFFKNKRVLITGHSGFKGSWLTRVLLGWDAKISGVSLKPGTNPNLFGLLKIKEGVRNYFCDIRDFRKIKDIILRENPEIIFHLAAQPLVRDSYDDPLHTFGTNIIGTANLLQAVKEAGGVRSVVAVTTDKVYENKETGHFFKETDKLGGHDPYSSSKAASEIIIDSYIKSFFSPSDYNKKHKTLVASARSGNVIGGGDWGKDRIIPDLIRSVFEKKEKLVMRSPNSIRPWQFVLEPLYGYMLLAKKLYDGEDNFSGAWNFGPNNRSCLTVGDLAEKSFKILKTGSYDAKENCSKHEAGCLRLNISKAGNILGWRPVFSINEALDLTIDWYKLFYEKKDIINLTDAQIKSFFGRI